MNEKKIAAHPLVAAYLEEVCSQVKAKDVHHDIARELLGHLIERIEDLKELEQLNDEEAITAAVKGMGDAREVGIGLNAAHKPKTEWSVVVIFAALLLLAVVALLVMPTASMISLTSKMIIGVVGLILLVAAYFANYQKLARWSWLLYGVTMASMLYVLLFGVQINGARQWLSIGGFSFNLHEVSPYLLMIAIVGILSKEQISNPTSSKFILQLKGCMRLVALILLPTLVYILTPSMSNFIVFTLSLFIILLVLGRWRFLLASVGTLITGMGLLLMYHSTLLHYLNHRLISIFSNHPDANYQAMRSMEAIRAGGLWGQGIGVANPNLPFFYSDMMYTYLIYSMGWLFGIVILFVVLAFILRTTQMGLKIKDRYGKTLIIGICSIFGIRLLWNVLMCLGLLPMMGISPPFLHFSSTTIIEIGLVGFMLGIYRRKDMITQQQHFSSSLVEER